MLILIKIKLGDIYIDTHDAFKKFENEVKSKQFSTLVDSKHKTDFNKNVKSILNTVVKKNQKSTLPNKTYEKKI